MIDAARHMLCLLIDEIKVFCYPKDMSQQILLL